jgi:hypothetical protein
MQPRTIYRPVQHLVMGAVTIFVLMLLAACGTNVGTPSTTTTGSNGGVTLAPTPTLATQNCGTVHTMRLLIVPTDTDRAKGVENCFWQAFQQCHPATLVYAQNNLDTGTIHNFSLKNVNGSCTITDGVQNFIAPRPAQKATNVTCTGLTQQTDGLHFHGCGESGDVLVPSVGAQ